MVNIEDYRNALLSFRDREQWRETDVNLRILRPKKLRLKGKVITLGDLVEEFTEENSNEEDYSHRSNFNRMLHECEIERFNYSNPDNIRGFLFSARGVEGWKDWEVSTSEFRPMQFQYKGMAKKGRMLALNIFMDEWNDENGTFYSQEDFTGNPELNSELSKAYSLNYLISIFNKSGVQIRDRHIGSEDIDKDVLREILLSHADEDEWRNLLLDRDEFHSLRFNLRPYVTFTGHSLLKRLRESKEEDLDIDDLFDLANLESGRTNPMLSRESRITRYNEKYGFLDDSDRVREIMLKLYSEKDWNKSKEFQEVRKRNFEYQGEKRSVHTLLNWYSTHKHNREQEQETGSNPYLFMAEIQDDPELSKGVLKSSKELLEELLEIGGIPHDNTFRVNITDYNLRNSQVLNMFLTNVSYEGEPTNVRRLLNMRSPSAAVRFATYSDPSSNFQISGHGLMIYYSTQDMRNQDLDMNKKEIFNKGRSNLSIFEEMVQNSGLDVL